MVDFISPELRQARLADRLAAGGTLGVLRLAEEFRVSVDTIRRDLAVLERAGLVRRVRGGAVPATPAAPLRARTCKLSDALLGRAARRLSEARTLILDGGSSVAALTRHLDATCDKLIITPSPQIAAAAHARGIAIVIVGGPVSMRGGIATGSAAEASIRQHYADVAVLGACGLDADDGLSSDDLPESEIKRAIAGAAETTLVLADAAKLGQRARHLTLRPDEIDILVTDADAASIAPFKALGVEILSDG